MTITEDAPAGHVGTRRLRKEDPALLTGEAKFIDDLALPGAVWVGVVRSTEAHANIVSIDGSAALQIDGVNEVLTGEDLAPLWGDGALPCAWPVTPDMKNPPHLPVARGTAKYVGDAVAVVLADSRYAAADGAAAVIVDYEPLPAGGRDRGRGGRRRTPRASRRRHQRVLHVGALGRQRRRRSTLPSRRRRTSSASATCSSASSRRRWSPAAARRCRRRPAESSPFTHPPRSRTFSR